MAREPTDLVPVTEARTPDLYEQKFMADRNDLNAEKEEEKEFEEQNDSNRPVIKNDFYFQEVLAITQDYLRLLKTPQAAAIGKR